MLAFEEQRVGLREGGDAHFHRDVALAAVNDLGVCDDFGAAALGALGGFFHEGCGREVNGSA